MHILKPKRHGRRLLGCIDNDDDDVEEDDEEDDGDGDDGDILVGIIVP